MDRKILISISMLFVVLMLSFSVSASERMYADTGDTIAYYGLDTPAGTSGYTYAICTEDGVFYMSDEQADTLGTHDYTLHQLVQYDLDKYSGSFRPDAVSFGSNGMNYYYNLDNSEDTEMFEIANNQNFAFEYKSGQQVGYNKDAKVVTKLYNMDGTEMT